LLAPDRALLEAFFAAELAPLDALPALLDAFFAADFAPVDALLAPLDAFFAPDLALLEAFFAAELPLLEALRAREVVPLLARLVPPDFEPDLLELPEPPELLEPERARLPEERLPRAVVPESPERWELSPWSCCSSCSRSSWPPFCPISFFATLTAAGTATPNAAPATTFFVVDIPSSSGSISYTSHVVVRVVHQSPRASLNDAMKRGMIRSRTISGAFCATNFPAALAASSAAGRSASRAASQPPAASEPNIVPP
jgi:hypothetical protein